MWSISGELEERGHAPGEEDGDAPSDGSDDTDMPDEDSDDEESGDNEAMAVNCEDMADGGCSCTGSQIAENISELGTHSLVDGFIRGSSNEDPDEGPNFRYCRDGDVLEANHVDPESGFSLLHVVMDLQ